MTMDSALPNRLLRWGGGIVPSLRMGKQLFREEYDLLKGRPRDLGFPAAFIVSLQELGQASETSWEMWEESEKIASA